MAETVLEVRGLVKYYGSLKALDHVSFKLARGSVFGYLGPNGAGKTTTIRAILGLVRADAGDILVNGFDPSKDPVHAFQGVGYAPELPKLHAFLTGEELLDLVGRLHGMPSGERKKREKELMELVGLSDHAKKKVGKYSKGMVQRLSVAQALMNEPELLIMDEPTIGMDPAATAYFRDLFRSMPKEGKTVLISSHLLEEVQKMCTDIGMINRGRIIFAGGLDDVISSFQDEWTVEVELGKVTKAVRDGLSKLDFIEGLQVDGHNLLIRMKKEEDRRGEIAEKIVEKGGKLLGLALHKSTLEEVYLRALKEGGPR
ncbi:MAG: ABC transporter ATP-binding protein [Candidatus Geothermarchaeales archaeon]